VHADYEADMSNAVPPGVANTLVSDDQSSMSAEDRELIARRERLLGPAYRLFYDDEPLHVVRGEGVWLFDAQGKRYLDAYNNVVSVGHCNPKITEALTRQASTLNTHTRYLHEGVLEYAERLLATFPSALGHVMLTCTGSEANDLAIRVSKAFTGGSGFIVTQWAYHGVTDAVSQLSPSLGAYVSRGDNIRTVAAPKSSRGRGVNVGEVFALNVQSAVDDLKSRGVKLAALLCDTIFSSDGVFPDPAGFLARAIDVVHDAGGLFIADEVQAGFGRTGDSMWGFARHGVTPDLVTLGKPMGNGHPTAALVMRPEVIAEFGRRSRYFNTFGGNPVSCAVALATLTVIQEEGLIENARIVGSYLLNGIKEIARTYDVIGDVRGAGLFIGVELVNAETNEPNGALARAVVNGLRRRGVLISATGPSANVLKIRPPLVLAKEHASLLIQSVFDVLQAEEPRS